MNWYLLQLILWHLKTLTSLCSLENSSSLLAIDVEQLPLISLNLHHQLPHHQLHYCWFLRRFSYHLGLRRRLCCIGYKDKYRLSLMLNALLVWPFKSFMLLPTTLITVLLPFILTSPKTYNHFLAIFQNIISLKGEQIAIMPLSIKPIRQYWHHDQVLHVTSVGHIVAVEIDVLHIFFSYLLLDPVVGHYWMSCGITCFW